MLDRRQILLSGAAAGAFATLTPVLSFAADASGGAALNKLFDTFMSESLDLSPEGATSLGIDTGPRAAQRGEVGDNSLAGIAKDKALTSSQLARLKAFNASSLSGMDALNYQVVMYGMVQQDTDNKRYNYGSGGAGAPYIISQLTGIYQGGPDFLASQQPLENQADAEYFMSRLDKFPLALDRDVEVARHDVALGVVPPDFALDKTLTQLGVLRNTPVEKSEIVDAIAKKTKEKNIPGDWQGRAVTAMNEKVNPALDRQIAFVKEMRGKATHDAGVWKLPNGQQYYADSLAAATTSTLSPQEVHSTGLAVVADYTKRIDAVMKANGLTGGTVGQRLRQMYLDPKFRYPNTDAGKEKLIADLNAKVKKIRALLPKYYGVLPKAALVIKRVPKATEAGAPGGYYSPGSLDGKRPGMYYINLRNTAEVPSWTLSTLTYHEGIPGHHLQLSIQQETDLPLIRKVSGFTAYIEGWALYSEQFADEIGMYDGDPWGRIGYMHDAMFRGVRLVVDSGMHAMKWSREQALKYYTDTLGDPESEAATEVERYCVWPGQACAYMVGKLEILKLRAKAKAALGPKFDIRQFHKAILVCGAVPLTVLGTVVDDYIAKTKAA